MRQASGDGLRHPPGMGSREVTLTVTLSAAQVEAIARRAAELVSERQQQASPYLDSHGAGEYLCCSRGRIFDLVQLGKLEPVRDGRRLLFRRSDLDAYLEAES